MLKLQVNDTIEQLHEKFGNIDAIWNIGGPEVYRLQLESGSLDNCRSYKLYCHSDNLFTVPAIESNFNCALKKFTDTRQFII